MTIAKLFGYNNEREQKIDALVKRIVSLWLEGKRDEAFEAEGAQVKAEMQAEPRWAEWVAKLQE